LDDHFCDAKYVQMQNVKQEPENNKVSNSESSGHGSLVKEENFDPIDIKQEVI